MIDGTEGLRAPATQIDEHILQHMLDETRDLLEEAPGYALEGSRTTAAAMVLTRADWLLMSVHNWIAGHMIDGYCQPLDQAPEPVGLDFGGLSVALYRFASRVDRLYSRARALGKLVGDAGSASAAIERPSAKILHIFGDPVADSGAANPVLETRRRLNWAFGGV